MPAAHGRPGVGAVVALTYCATIDQRREIRRAIVAIARRLAVVLHRMWVHGTEFRWSKDSATILNAA